MSPKSPAWLTQLSYPVDSKLFSDFCIARDCFMILMLRSFQFNALSCGNQRPNLPYKKACRDIFEGFRLHQLPPETLLLCYWNLRFWTSTYKKTVPSHQESNYTLSWVAVDFNFNSDVFQSTQHFLLGLCFHILRSQPTIAFGIKQYTEMNINHI